MMGLARLFRKKTAMACCLLGGGIEAFVSFRLIQKDFEVKIDGPNRSCCIDFDCELMCECVPLVDAIDRRRHHPGGEEPSA